MARVLGEASVSYPGSVVVRVVTSWLDDVDVDASGVEEDGGGCCERVRGMLQRSKETWLVVQGTDPIKDTRTKTGENQGCRGGSPERVRC